MREELHGLLAGMPDEASIGRAGRRFWVGPLDRREVVAVLSGIGKVAAATTATLLLAEFGVSRIVLTGTAVGLREEVAMGDVVVGETLLQHDMDASPLFKRHEVPLYGLDRFPADAGLSTILVHAASWPWGKTAAHPKCIAACW